MSIKIKLNFKPSLLFLIRLFLIIPLNEIEDINFISRKYLEKIINFGLKFTFLRLKNNQQKSIKINIKKNCSINPNFYFEIMKFIDSCDSLLLYSDSMIEYKNEIEYIAKPIWSPTLFKNLDYLGEVLIYKTNGLDTFNWESDLNFIFENKKICINRIPEALYTIKIKNKLNYEKTFKNERFKKSNKELVNQKEENLDNFTIIIPTKFQKINGNKVILRLIDSIIKNFPTRNFEIIIGFQSKFNEDFNLNILNNKLYEKILIKSYQYTYDFNFSKVVNECVTFAEHEYILLLNDDVYFDENIDLDCIFGHLMNKNIGVVGAKLLYPSKLIQHDGIYFENFQPQNFLQGSSLDFMPDAQKFCREVTAVSGAFMFFKKNIFQNYKGFCENLPNNYNDVEFCLRLQENGLNAVVCNSSIIYHEESLTRNKHKYLKIEEDLNKLKTYHEIHTRDEYLFTPNFPKFS